MPSPPLSRAAGAVLPVSLLQSLRSSSSTPTEPRSQRPVVAPGPRRRWVSRTRSEMHPARARRQWVSPTRYEEHFCEHVQPKLDHWRLHWSHGHRRRTAEKGTFGVQFASVGFQAKESPTSTDSLRDLALCTSMRSIRAACCCRDGMGASEGGPHSPWDVSRTPKHLPFAVPEPSKASSKATCKTCVAKCLVPRRAANA